MGSMDRFYKSGSCKLFLKHPLYSLFWERLLCYQNLVLNVLWDYHNQDIGGKNTDLKYFLQKIRI